MFIKSLLASAIALSLTGCAAIPMVAAGLNGANKKGD